MLVKTDSVLGSDQHMAIEFFDESEKTYAGGFNLLFTSPPQYFLYWCNVGQTYTTFPAAFPTETDKVWKITLARSTNVRLVFHCNNVEVLNVLISNSDCPDNEWSKFWNRDVAGIKFRSDDTASDFYINTFNPGNQIS